MKEINKLKEELGLRDLLVGMFRFIPEKQGFHRDEIITYLNQRIDVSTSEIKENLNLLCGENYYPKILKKQEEFYTYTPDKINCVKNFIEERYTEEQLEGLRKLALDFSKNYKEH